MSLNANVGVEVYPLAPTAQSMKTFWGVVVADSFNGFGSILSCDGVGIFIDELGYRWVGGWWVVPLAVLAGPAVEIRLGHYPTCFTLLRVIGEVK